MDENWSAKSHGQSTISKKAGENLNSGAFGVGVRTTPGAAGWVDDLTKAHGYSTESGLRACSGHYPLPIRSVKGDPWRVYQSMHKKAGTGCTK